LYLDLSLLFPSLSTISPSLPPSIRLATSDSKLKVPSREEKRARRERERHALFQRDPV